MPKIKSQTANVKKKKKEKEIKQYLQDAKVGIETGDKFYADF